MGTHERARACARAALLGAPALALASCAGAFGGGGGGDGTGTATVRTLGGGGDGAANAGGEGNAEVRALVTEALTPQLCPKLLESFIGLPGEGTARGPAAGTLPTAGRWWIRRCNARTTGERLTLAMGGSGWTWVDREASGFRIRQYMLFEADVELSADVSVGYDRQRRIASLWMTPSAGVTAQVVPRGVVTAEATGIFSAVIGGILPLTGSSASDRARAQVEQIGSQQMRERLGAGFTMTLDLERRQTDFMVGALARGETPQRPYPNDTPGPWQINQRVQVYPGGLDVIGPLDLNTSQGLDLQLEEGEAASVRSVCAEPMGAYLEQRLRAPSSNQAPPAGIPVAELTPGVAQHVTLPTAACPTLLLVTPHANATLPIKLRLRVAAESGAALPARPSRARLQLVGATVRAQNASNRDWDVVGGEADVYVTTASVALGRQLDRTPTVADHNTATWDRWLPGTFDLARDFPLRFTVMDEDSTSDELIGYADLDAAALPAQSGELSLPVRTGGAVPTQMGTLRLRVELSP